MADTSQQQPDFEREPEWLSGIESTEPSDLKQNFSYYRDKPFRTGQSDAIRFGVDSSKPNSVIIAPTGAGKSLIGACIGSSFSSFTYLVASKQLQDQLVEDFPEIAVLKGRANYKCLLNEAATCDQCIHNEMFKCPYKSDCLYEVQKRIVLKSPFRLLNYPYMLTECNYIGKFSDQQVFICDEGDTVESLLTDFITVSMSGAVVKNLHIDPPKYKSADKDHKVSEWVDWAKAATTKVSEGIKDVLSQIKAVNSTDPDALKLIRRKQTLENLKSRLNIFINHVNNTWIYEERPSRFKGALPTITFRPIWTPDALSHEFFFRHAKKFVFMSATFPPINIMGVLLGREPESFDYIDLPSTFPVSNRKVWLNAVGNLTTKTFDIEAPKIVDEIKRIIESDEHRSQKGIVHTVSYKLANMVMKIGSKRLITHDSFNREETVRKFKSSKDPLILVSPSMERGLDLPGDQARFTIIAKAPYQSLGDKLVNRRLYSGALGQLWYTSLTLQLVIQMVGRAVRGPDDYAKTYILDGQCTDLLIRQQKLLPGYFKESLEIY